MKAKKITVTFKDKSQPLSFENFDYYFEAKFLHVSNKEMLYMFRVKCIESLIIKKIPEGE